MPDSPVIRTGREAEQRLSELGLELDDIDGAIRAGVGAWYERNDFEPRSAPGLKDWIARVGELRRRVVGRGRMPGNVEWSYADPKNAPIVYRLDERRALGLLLGDKDTGNEHTDGPRSNYPKGPIVAAATARHTLQQTLPINVTSPSGRGALYEVDLRQMEVWWLVTFPVATDDQFLVRREVSLAQPVEPGQHVASWIERLIFPPMEFPPVAGGQEPQPPDSPDDTDFNIEDVM